MEEFDFSCDFNVLPDDDIYQKLLSSPPSYLQSDSHIDFNFDTLPVPGFQDVTDYASTDMPTKFAEPVPVVIIDDPGGKEGSVGQESEQLGISDGVKITTPGSHNATPVPVQNPLTASGSPQLSESSMIAQQDTHTPSMTMSSCSSSAPSSSSPQQQTPSKTTPVNIDVPATLVRLSQRVENLEKQLRTAHEEGRNALQNPQVVIKSQLDANYLTKKEISRTFLPREDIEQHITKQVETRIREFLSNNPTLDDGGACHTPRNPKRMKPNEEASSAGSSRGNTPIPFNRISHSDVPGKQFALQSRQEAEIFLVHICSQLPKCAPTNRQIRLAGELFQIVYHMLTCERDRIPVPLNVQQIFGGIARDFFMEIQSRDLRLAVQRGLASRFQERQPIWGLLNASFDQVIRGQPLPGPGVQASGLITHMQPMAPSAPPVYAVPGPIHQHPPNTQFIAQIPPTAPLGEHPMVPSVPQMAPIHAPVAQQMGPPPPPEVVYKHPHQPPYVTQPVQDMSVAEYTQHLQQAMASGAPAVAVPVVLVESHTNWGSPKTSPHLMQRHPRSLQGQGTPQFSSRPVQGPVLVGDGTGMMYATDSTSSLKRKAS